MREDKSWFGSSSSASSRESMWLYDLWRLDSSQSSIWVSSLWRFNGVSAIKDSFSLKKASKRGAKIRERICKRQRMMRERGGWRVYIERGAKVGFWSK